MHKDLNASFVGALTALPQAVAYGLIAVSPLGSDWAAFGIASSVGSAVLFGVLGGAFSSNPFLISGPRAITALILAVGIQAGLERSLSGELAILLAFAGVFLSGFLQTLYGVLRLGHIASYVSVPVLAGFVSASALLVVMNTLPTILGLGIQEFLVQLQTGQLHWDLWALSVGGTAIVAILLLGDRIKFVPSALLGLVAASVVYYLGTHLYGLSDGPLVGQMHTQLWAPMLSIFPDQQAWPQLSANADIALSVGFSISLLASFDTVLSSTSLDIRSGTHSRANPDLLKQGLLNMLMGGLGYLPGSGTISRSSAILSAGAQTRLANVGSGVVFLLMITLVAPWMANLPLWASAGMLIATSLQAIDRETLRKMGSLLTHQIRHWQVIASDVLITLTVVISAFVFDLNVAVGLGIALSVLSFSLNARRDPIRRVLFGNQLSSNVQRSHLAHESLRRLSQRILVVELQGALFFGSSAELFAQIRRYVEQGMRVVILDFRRLTSLDSSGSSVLIRIKRLCDEQGVKLQISCLERERRRAPSAASRRRVEKERRMNKESPRWIWLNMQANQVFESIPEHALFDDTYSALAYSEDWLLQQEGHDCHASAKALLKQSPLLQDLDAVQIASLASYVTLRKVRSGRNLICQGSTTDRQAYFLLRGSLEVLIDIPGSQRRRRISTMMPGTLVGEMTLLDSQPRSAYVKATAPVLCFSISVEAFERLRQDMPDVAFTLIKNLSLLCARKLRLATDVIAGLEQ